VSGAWQCTRCGSSDTFARENGCSAAPCPMEWVEPADNLPIVAATSVILSALIGGMIIWLLP
jgi:hypothetical protein